MATLSDVARHAGVSESSVSRILNGQRKANRPSSRKQVQRVLAIAQELGYQPNLAARAMRSGRTHQIGVLFPELSNPASGQTVEAIERALLKSGNRMVIGLSERSIDRAREYLQGFGSGMVDGLINLDPVISQEWLENHCGSIPVVTYNRLDGQSPAVMDHAAGMRMAYEHLVALGHRQIGLLSGPRSDLGAMSRINGFLSCALSMPHTTPIEPVIDGDWEMDSGEAAASEVVAKGFTGMVCSNDLMAIGLMRGLRQLGKRVPEDCSIVGFDNTLLSKAGDPPMTTLSQALDEIAHRTVETLMAKIEGKDELPVEAFPPRLIVRQSTMAVHATP
ncbi:MAG: hypothetical protein CMJ19_20940 [Phycisphaeraceae bacterium]|nr:hypothetical protein [Phycisphaeraceae bacterium]